MSNQLKEQLVEAVCQKVNLPFTSRKALFEQHTTRGVQLKKLRKTAIVILETKDVELNESIKKNMSDEDAVQDIYDNATYRNVLVGYVPNVVKDMKAAVEDAEKLKEIAEMLNMKASEEELHAMAIKRMSTFELLQRVLAIREGTVYRRPSPTPTPTTSAGASSTTTTTNGATNNKPVNRKRLPDPMYGKGKGKHAALMASHSLEDFVKESAIQSTNIPDIDISHDLEDAMSWNHCRILSAGWLSEYQNAKMETLVKTIQKDNSDQALNKKVVETGIQSLINGGTCLDTNEVVGLDHQYLVFFQLLSPPSHNLTYQGVIFDTQDNRVFRLKKVGNKVEVLDMGTAKEISLFVGDDEKFMEIVYSQGEAPNYRIVAELTKKTRKQKVSLTGSDDEGGEEEEDEMEDVVADDSQTIEPVDGPDGHSIGGLSMTSNLIGSH
jgi:hypothetical protein